MATMEDNIREIYGSNVRIKDTHDFRGNTHQEVFVYLGDKKYYAKIRTKGDKTYAGKFIGLQEYKSRNGRRFFRRIQVKLNSTMHDVLKNAVETNTDIRVPNNPSLRNLIGAK